jgi:hypothetical protein
MNEEEEESPLEDLRVRRNRLAQERHTVQSKEQRATDASRQAAQRARNVQHESVQRELNRTNQGGNQVIPLARREFDGSHHGFHHTLGEMTTMCGKCGTLHFLEECAMFNINFDAYYSLLAFAFGVSIVINIYPWSLSFFFLF